MTAGFLENGISNTFTYQNPTGSENKNLKLFGMSINEFFEDE